MTPSLRAAALAALFCLLSALPLLATDNLKKQFDVPAGSADSAIKRFSEQAGLEVLYPSEITKGVATKSVKGEMTAQAALDAMLAGSGLSAVQDSTTGAFSLRRATDPKAPRAALPNASGRPQKTETAALAAAAVEGHPAGDSDPSKSDGKDDSNVVRLDPLRITSASASGYSVHDASSSSRMNLPYIDVPQTVTVLTNEQLNDLHINVSRDAIAWAQSVVAPNNGSNGGNYRIRGLGISAAYRDGFQVSTSRNDRDMALYDRVEVVSGPASAAIGRGEAGGLINYVSKKPIERNFLTYSVTGGTDAYYRAEVDVNRYYSGHAIAARVPAFFQDSDGTYGGELNHTRKYGAAPSLLWNLSDKSQLVLNLTGWRNEGPSLSSEVDYLDSTGTIFRLRQSLGQYVNSAWNPFQYRLPDKDQQAWGYRGGANINDVAEFSAVLTSKLTDKLDLRLGLFGDGMRNAFRFFQKSPNTYLDPKDPNNFIQPLNFLINYSNSMQARNQGDLLYHFDVKSTKNTIDVGYDAFTLRSGVKSGQTSLVNGVALTDNFYNPQHVPPPGFNVYTSAPITARSITHQRGIGYYVQYLGSYFSDRILINAGIRQDNTVTRTFNAVNRTYVLNAAQVTRAPRYSLTYKPLPNLSFYYLRSYQEDPPATTLKYTTFQASGGAVLPPPGDPRYTTYITGQTKAVLDEFGFKGNFLNRRLTASVNYYRIQQDGALASTPVNDPSQATPEHPQALLVWAETYLTSGVVYKGWEMAVSGYFGRRFTFTAMYNIPEGTTLFNGAPAPGQSLIRTAKLLGKYSQPFPNGRGLEATLGFRELFGNWTIRSNSPVKMMEDQEGLDLGIAYYWKNHAYDVSFYCANVTDSPQFASTNNNVELRRFFLSFSKKL